MANNWKAWIPDQDLDNKYFICKVVDDADGLHLFLISNRERKPAKVAAEIQIIRPPANSSEVLWFQIIFFEK